MKLSIIVPVYNASKTLEKCLNSLLQQTIKDFEIIAVDDGSTDTSLRILQSYKIKHNQLQIYHKENGGQASARNLGLQYANGTYIGFVDSDDWVDSTMFEEMVTALEKSNMDVAVCDMIEHFADHEIYHDFTNTYYAFAQAGSACNKVFRKEQLKDIIFPIGLWYEDLAFTAKVLLTTTRIIPIQKGFYHYLCVDNSTMHNQNTKKNLDMIAIFNDIICFANEHDYYKVHEDDLCYLYMNHVYITTINRIASHNSKERNQVIQAFVQFGSNQFPQIFLSQKYRSTAKSRKLIARLNGSGHWRIAQFILHCKQILHSQH